MDQSTPEMPTWPLIDHRKTDDACEELHVALSKTNERVAALERKCESMATAFIRDDLGGPDYSGHRVAHIEQKEASKRITDLKQSGAKKIIDLVLVFLIGVFVSGAVAWLKNQR